MINRKIVCKSGPRFSGEARPTAVESAQAMADGPARRATSCCRAYTGEVDVPGPQERLFDR